MTVENPEVAVPPVLPGIETPPAAVQIKDPTTGQMIEVTPEVKTLINTMQGIARKDAATKTEQKFKPLQDLVDNVQAENSDLAKQFQEFKDSQLPKEEQLQNQYQRNIEAAELNAKTQTERGDKWKSKFYDNQIKNDIYGAFGEYSLVNSEDTAILFKQAGETRIEEKIDSAGKGTGEYETRVKIIMSDDNGGYVEQEGTPKEIFKLWISQDSKKHLLANPLQPGAGSSHGGNTTPTTGLAKLEAQYDEAMKDKNMVAAIAIKSQISAAQRG